MHESISQLMELPYFIEVFYFFWITLEYISEASTISKTF